VFHITDLKVVGIATPDADGAATTFRKNFGFSISRSTENTAAKTRSEFLSIGGAEIEMRAPTGEGSSPLSSLLAERGTALHHLVLEVDDLPAALAELKAKGIEAVAEQGADGEPAASLGPAQTHGVRIMLVGR